MNAPIYLDFTANATEANNIALLGVAAGHAPGGDRNVAADELVRNWQRLKIL